MIVRGTSMVQVRVLCCLDSDMLGKDIPDHSAFASHDFCFAVFRITFVSGVVGLYLPFTQTSCCCRRSPNPTVYFSTHIVNSFGSFNTSEAKAHHQATPYFIRIVLDVANRKEDTFRMVRVLILADVDAKELCTVHRTIPGCSWRLRSPHFGMGLVWTVDKIHPQQANITWISLHPPVHHSRSTYDGSLHSVRSIGLERVREGADDSI